ncbi:energy transducer TonB [Massilia sp. Dwa41.01b]|uniref:energy transducer TonB n=1 Tax=unclassified Massilia TaxID=2609279 RepID=UPI0016030243|nr:MULTISPECIES: energy transducer TonB [unclassified Massilia]QNA90131.1 energy transducer TonB [Massilia sp. Dwa41.01b]QNB01021.1 energy transducer TonB [Massilia sp. Se16.2.3]
MNFSHEKEPGKNLTGITIVVLLHVLVAWGIINGLGTKVISKVQEAVETKLIEEVKPPPPPETPPPPPPPEMKAPPPPFIPPVEVQVTPPPPSPTAIAATTSTPPPTTSLTPPAPPAPAAQPSPAAGPSRTPAVADFSTCAKPEYPKASARNEEEGTTTISFLIGVDGRMVDSKITKSSGSRDLDRAAQQAIGKCRFKPAMVNGQPEQAWVPVQYVWSLEQ